MSIDLFAGREEDAYFLKEREKHETNRCSSWC